MKVEVKHKKEEYKFFVVLEGSEASINYKPVKGNILEIMDTLIPKGLRGKGIGKELIIAVFDYARSNNLRIIPKCPFVVKFIEMNSEFGHLVCQNI